MGEAIAVTSGKGGVGKSNVCLNVGVSLVKKGYKVCLLDMDFGLRNLDVLMGLENRVIYDIKDVMDGNCNIKQALIRDKKLEQLYLLPAVKGMQIHIEKEDVKKIVAYLKEEFDYVLLDSAAGMESGFMNSIACVEKTIVVTTLDYTALKDADRVIGLLFKEQMKDVLLVVNKVNPRHIEKGISVSLQEALSFLSIDLLGIVYESEDVIRYNNKGYPVVYDNGNILSDCFKVIVARLEGIRMELPKFKGKSFMQRVFNT